MFNRTFLKALPLYGILTLFLSSCMLFSASSLQNPALRIILPGNNSRASWNIDDVTRITEYQITLTKDTETIGPKLFSPGSEAVFTFDELEAGLWNVTVIALIGEDEFARGQADAEIRDGETTPVEIVMTVADKFLQDDAAPEKTPEQESPQEPESGDSGDHGSEPFRVYHDRECTDEFSIELIEVQLYDTIEIYYKDPISFDIFYFTDDEVSRDDYENAYVQDEDEKLLIIAPTYDGSITIHRETDDATFTIHFIVHKPESLKEFYGDEENPGNISYTEFSAYGQIVRLDSSFTPESYCTIEHANLWDSNTTYTENSLFQQFTEQYTDNGDSITEQYCRIVGIGNFFELELLYYDDNYLPQRYGPSFPATVYGIGSSGILASFTCFGQVEYYLFLTDDASDEYDPAVPFDIKFELFFEAGLTVEGITSSSDLTLITN